MWDLLPGQLYPFSYRHFRGIMFLPWLRKIIEFCVKNYHREVTFMSTENFVAWSKKIPWAPNFPFSPCRHKNDGPCQSECVQVLIPLQHSVRAGLTWKAVMLIILNLQEFDSVRTTWHLVWKVWMFLWGSDNIACMTLWFFPFQKDATNRKSHFANVSRTNDDLRAGLSMQLTHVPMKRSPWP